MTKRIKNGIIIGGTSIASLALAVTIAARFEKPEATAVYAPESLPASSIIVEEIKPTTSENNANSAPEIPEKLEIPESNDEREEYSSYTEIEQSFPEAVKDETPPAPPEIEDKTELTNPVKQPEYKSEQPEQTEQKPDNSDKKPETQTPTGTPKNGDKKDGKIYITGFGWIADKGGGGQATYAEDMYENGNKIGYFG